VFSNRRELVYFNHDIVSSPNYWLSSGIGIDDSPDPIARSVPLWYVLPEASAQTEAATWVFRNEQELASLLRRVYDSAIVPCAVPLFNDRHAFLRRIGAFSKEMEAEDIERRRREARSRLDGLEPELRLAWAGRDYRRFVVLMMPFERLLSEAERAKLAYAKRHSGRCDA